MREDNEYILVRCSAGYWVHKWLNNVRMVHVQVAAQNPPEDSLESRETVSIYGPGNKFEVERTVCR